MRIGLVGKPNVGKSTTFAALTETAVEIANYPFTTIEANVGVTYISAPEDCACKELQTKFTESGRPLESPEGRGGSVCSPNKGACNRFARLVPVTLVDVAGLVPGAHAGRGRGNQFLSDLASCDALIQVVDASGGTDIEGNPVGEGAMDPLEEHEFLIEELAAWIDGILENGWGRAVRRIQSEGDSGLVNFVHEHLTGIGATHSDILNAIDSMRSENPNILPLGEWTDTERTTLAKHVRRVVFPLFVAGNKADLADPATFGQLQSKVEEEGGLYVSCSAESELALRRASKAGAIDYEPGASSFSLVEGIDLNDAQRKGLAKLGERLESLGGTGLDRIINDIVYSRLSRMVAYPVQDENRWVDGDGNVLPDALLIPEGTTAKGLAYAVHSDLGDGFVKAVDGRSGRVLGADAELENGAVVKIHAKT